jgi:hypothetical protein
MVWLLKQLSFHSLPRSFAIMAIVNGLTLSATVIAAKRWLGRDVAFVTGLFAVLIAHTLGGEQLGDWWNPYPPVVWFFAFMVGVIAVVYVGGNAPWLWTVLFGCLTAQAHVSFMILVVVASVAVAVGARLTRAVRRPRPTRWRWGAPIIAGFWVFVLWDLAFGIRNLNRIKRYLTQSHKRAGLAKGLQLASREFLPWGPLVRGSQPHDLGGIVGASTGLLAITAVAIVVLALLAMRDRPVLVLVLPAGALALVAAFSASGLEGFLFDYLVTYLLATAAVVWWLVGIGVVRRSTRPIVPAVVASVLVLIVLVASLGTMWRDTKLPGQDWAPVVDTAAAKLVAHFGRIDHPIVLDYLDDEAGLIAPGVIANLASHYDVRSLDAAKFFKWGHQRAYLPKPPLDGYTIIPVYPDGGLGPANRCVMAHHPQVVLSTTGLKPSEARDYQQLRILNYVRRGKLNSVDAPRYAALWKRAARVIVVAGLYRSVC